MLLFFYATIPLSPAKKNAGAAEQFFHGGGEAAADGGTGREAPPPLLSRPSPSKCEGSVPNVAAMMGKCKSSVPYIDGARGI